VLCLAGGREFLGAVVRAVQGAGRGVCHARGGQRARQVPTRASLLGALLACPASVLASSLLPQPNCALALLSVQDFIASSSDLAGYVFYYSTPLLVCHFNCQITCLPATPCAACTWRHCRTRACALSECGVSLRHAEWLPCCIWCRCPGASLLEVRLISPWTSARRWRSGGG